MNKTKNGFNSYTTAAKPILLYPKRAKDGSLFGFLVIYIPKSLTHNFAGLGDYNKGVGIDG